MGRMRAPPEYKGDMEKKITGKVGIIILFDFAPFDKIAQPGKNDFNGLFLEIFFSKVTFQCFRYLQSFIFVTLFSLSA